MTAALGAGLLSLISPPLLAQTLAAPEAASVTHTTAAAAQASVIPASAAAPADAASAHPAISAANPAAAPEATASAPAAQEPVQEQAPSASNGPSFAIRIQAPSDIRSLVNRFLDLKRYQQVPDLDNAELLRLLELS
ncbi:MAG: hypothetical protein Q4A11_05605, partial [Brachymonas sp.]|nr:hypothetical protein [Brachymonas sp.]